MPLPKLYALFVGDSGDGKSCAAASFPEEYHQMDFDLRWAGVQTAIDSGLLKPAKRSHTEFPPGSNAKRVKTFIEALETARIAGQFPYGTIEVASITQLSRFLLKFSTKLTGGEKLAKGFEGTFGSPGMQDYKWQTSTVHDIFDDLKKLPCNVIASGHLVDKYGTPPGDNPYAPKIVVRSKLSVSDNLGANILTYFNDVYQFSRNVIGGKLVFSVEFSNDIAKNTFGLPPGSFDITNREFYPFFEDLVQQVKDKTLKPPKPPSPFNF